MEACSSSNMCLLLFPLLQVTTESPISTQSHHNSQTNHLQSEAYFTTCLASCSCFPTTHSNSNSQALGMYTYLIFVIFNECGLPLPVKQPTGSGRPSTLKPGFAKRQFRKCFFLGLPVYIFYEDLFYNLFSSSFIFPYYTLQLRTLGLSLDDAALVGLNYKTIEDGSITEDFWIIQVHILPIEIPFGS